MEPEGSSPHSQDLITFSCPEPDRSSLCPHPISRRSILILSSHLRLRLLSVFFLQVSSLKLCVHLASPTYVLHALPISLFLILLPETYLVRSTEHKAPCYVVFSASLLPRPS